MTVSVRKLGRGWTLVVDCGSHELQRHFHYKRDAESVGRVVSGILLAGAKLKAIDCERYLLNFYGENFFTRVTK